MIAQADSRKWMACLYNSFLFMEAKIMKMAKKLLAVVLTGVMAVSMLTGCALTDKIKENALVDALNYEGKKVSVKYEEGTKANDTAETSLTNAMDAAKKAFKAQGSEGDPDRCRCRESQSYHQSRWLHRCCQGDPLQGYQAG